MPGNLSELSAELYYAHNGSMLSQRLTDTYLAMIPSGHHASILRYNRWQDRQATLFGRLLLLKALQDNYQKIGITKFHELQLSQYGKPFIKGGPEFNISHCENIVVLALTRNQPIGIDIEKIRSIDINDFSKELPEVADLFKQHDNAEANHLFFDCWTRKEAVLKGFGQGLLLPLNNVVLKGSQASIKQTRWFLKKIPIDQQYCCHIATQTPIDHVTIKSVHLIA